jgi:hypothetical protein
LGLLDGISAVEFPKESVLLWNHRKGETFCVYVKAKHLMVRKNASDMLIFFIFRSDYSSQVP